MATNSFWKNRSTLITGASGYLGHLLAEELARRGARIIGADVGDFRPDFAGQVVRQDLRDIPAVTALLTKNEVKTVIHLAGQSGVASSKQNPVGAFEANVTLTWTLLEACRRCPQPPEVVAASSNHVYGEQKVQPTPEDAVLDGLEPYAASKACGDIAARCFAHTYDLPVAVARITNTFGGADPHSKHLVTGTLLAAMRGEAPVITGHPLSRKGFLYLKDTMEGFILLAEKIGPLRLRGEAFNFCPDEAVTVQDMMTAVLKAAGRPDLKPSAPNASTAHKENEHLCNKKASKMLGWRPSLTLEEGLRLAAADLARALAQPAGAKKK